MGDNYFLKRYPPESHSWAGKVTFCFSYPANGWIQLAVTCDPYLQGVFVFCTYIADPFPGFKRWLEAIVADQLPAECAVDEEGKGKTFRARPVNNQEFIFEILEYLWGKPDHKDRPVYLYVQVNKTQFLSEFMKRWDDFIENYYDPVHWEEYGTDLRKLDLSKIRAFLGE